MTAVVQALAANMSWCPPSPGAWRRLALVLAWLHASAFLMPVIGLSVAEWQVDTHTYCGPETPRYRYLSASWPGSIGVETRRCDTVVKTIFLFAKYKIPFLGEAHAQARCTSECQP